MAEPSWEGMLHTSKSQLQTYLQCSQRYLYQYVLATPWEAMPATMVFGRAMHRAVALYYRRTQTNLDVTREELEALFHSSWAEERGELPLRFSRGATETAMKAQARELLHCFLKAGKPHRIEAVEQPFTVDLVHPDTGATLPIKLAGVIDLLESDSEGHVIVSELKTSARRYTE
jgi:putative RecB family exonuclease